MFHLIFMYIHTNNWLYFQFVGDPVLYIQQFIVFAHVSPWRPHLQNSMVIKEALKPAFRITNVIEDFQFSYGYVIFIIVKQMSDFFVLVHLHAIFQVEFLWGVFMVILHTHLQDCQSKVVVLTTLTLLCMSSCAVFFRWMGIIQCLCTSCVANVSLIWWSKGFQFVPRSNVLCPNTNSSDLQKLSGKLQKGRSLTRTKKRISYRRCLPLYVCLLPKTMKRDIFSRCTLGLQNCHPHWKSY